MPNSARDELLLARKAIDAALDALDAANDPPKAETNPEPSAPTHDDLMAALRPLASAKGAEAVKGLLARYNVSKVSDLPEWDFEAVIADAERAA